MIFCIVHGTANKAYSIIQLPNSTFVLIFQNNYGLILFSDCVNILKYAIKFFAAFLIKIEPIVDLSQIRFSLITIFDYLIINLLICVFNFLFTFIIILLKAIKL